MATRNWKKPAASNSSLASRILLSLICLVSLFLCFSLFRKDIVSPSLANSVVSEKSNSNCNYSDGRWIYDPMVSSPIRYDHTCKEIFKGWNCIASNKSNAIDILKWRWKPYNCDLPPFDPLRFLDKFRNSNIGFIGDSLNRNMFVSLFCTLKHVTPDVKKWGPTGADRGFTFVKYNLTITYHRTNLLARYVRRKWEVQAGVVAEANALAKNKVMRRQTTFALHHASHPWSRSRILIWMLCFLKQIKISVHKSDYMALRLMSFNWFLTCYKLCLKINPFSVQKVE